MYLQVRFYLTQNYFSSVVSFFFANILFNANVIPQATASKPIDKIGLYASHATAIVKSDSASVIKKTTPPVYS